MSYVSNLLNVLLPEDLILKMENEELEEGPLLAISKLVANVIIGLTKAWGKQEIKKFDPNPGDNACQIRAFLLRQYFFDEELREEASKLQQTFKKTLVAVNKRNTAINQKKSLELSRNQYVREHFGNHIVISKKIEFLSQCYLLAFTRVPAPVQTNSNGVITTVTDRSRLKKLSARIDIIPKETRRKIIEIVQRHISANSIELLRLETEKLTFLDRSVQKHIVDMLSPHNLHLYTPSSKYEPKTYGCQLYEYQAVLIGLKATQSLVCIKSIVPKPKIPFWILLRPVEAQEDFSILADEAYSEFLSHPVVVFEGVIHADFDKDTFSAKIMQIGFTQLILACAAIEPPYERTSDLSSVKDEQAKEEVARYRKIAQKINCHKEAESPLLVLDHIYCNLLANEIVKTNRKDK